MDKINLRKVISYFVLTFFHFSIVSCIEARPKENIHLTYNKKNS